MSCPWKHSRTGRAPMWGDHRLHSEQLSQGEAVDILALLSPNKSVFLLGITAAGCTHCAETRSIYLHVLCHYPQLWCRHTGGPFPTPSPSPGAFFQKSSRSNPLDHLPSRFISPGVGGREDTRGWIHRGSVSLRSLRHSRLASSTKPGSHRRGGLPSSDRSGDTEPPLSLCSTAAGTKSAGTAEFTASLQVPRPR